MYIVKNFNDIIEDREKYKLCYIDSISPTFSDYTPETKEYMGTEQYKKDREIYGWNNPRCQLKDYPNPDFIKRKQEFYAYFAKPDPSLIWGDDFDDTPYEYNSGEPYDNVGDEEITIIKIPFCIDLDEFVGGGLEMKEPKDYGWNSPFSTEDINLGAVPWIFVRTTKYKGDNIGISIMAGLTIPEFEEKLKLIGQLRAEELKGNLEFLGVYKKPDKSIAYAVKNTKTYCIRFYDQNFNVIPIYYKNSDYLGYDMEEVYSLYEDDREWEEIKNTYNLVSKVEPGRLLESIYGV